MTSSYRQNTQSHVPMRTNQRSGRQARPPAQGSAGTTGATGPDASVTTNPIQAGQCTPGARACVGCHPTGGCDRRCNAAVRGGWPIRGRWHLGARSRVREGAVSRRGAGVALRSASAVVRGPPPSVRRDGPSCRLLGLAPPGDNKDGELAKPAVHVRRHAGAGRKNWTARAHRPQADGLHGVRPDQDLAGPFPPKTSPALPLSCEGPFSKWATRRGGR